MVDQRLLKMKPSELLVLHGLKPAKDPLVLFGVKLDMSDSPTAEQLLRNLRAYADDELARIEGQKATKKLAAVKAAAPVVQEATRAAVQGVDNNLAQKIQGDITREQVSSLLEHPLVDEDVKRKIEEATASVEIDRDAIKDITLGEPGFFQKVRNFFRRLFHRNGEKVEDPFSLEAIDIIDTMGKESFEPPQAAIHVEAKALIDIIPTEPVSDVPARLDPARRVKPSRAKPTIWTVAGTQKPLVPAIHRNREHDPLGIDTIDDEIRAIIRGEIPCV
jgi:hypothetical protein